MQPDVIVCRRSMDEALRKAARRRSGFEVVLVARKILRHGDQLAPDCLSIASVEHRTGPGRF